MDRNLRKQLTEQLTFYWASIFLPRLEGLTDDEYLWEPVRSRRALVVSSAYRNHPPIEGTAMPSVLPQ